MLRRTLHEFCELKSCIRQSFTFAKYFYRIPRHFSFVSLLCFPTIFIVFQDDLWSNWPFQFSNDASVHTHLAAGCLIFCFNFLIIMGYSRVLDIYPKYDNFSLISFIVHILIFLANHRNLLQHQSISTISILLLQSPTIAFIGAQGELPPVWFWSMKS